MRALAIVAALGSVAGASPPARVTVDHGEGWRFRSTTPIKVRVDAGRWTTVAYGKSSAAIDLAAGDHGRAVAFDAPLPGTGAGTFRRWAVLMPGARYRMVGNPCAGWGLDVEHDPAAAGADRDQPTIERVQLDARDLPASAFPLAITASDAELEDADAPGTPSATRALLDKPGMSAPVELMVSAMCMRSGTHITVRTRGAKRPLFSETLIPHPGQLHTLTLRRQGFSVTISP